MLFHHGEEKGNRILLWKYYGFSQETAALGTANVEGICQTGQVLHGHIIAFRHEAIGQAGTVHVEGKMVFMAGPADFYQFLQCIERAVFRGLGNINQRRHHHVFMVSIGPVAIYIFCNLGSPDFPFFRWQLQYLVAAIFNGPGFMDRDMAGPGRNDSFIGTEHGINDGGIGLGTANEEIYVRLRRTGSFPDFIPGGF